MSVRTPWRRLMAYTLDFLVIAVYGVLLFLVSWSLQGGEPEPFSNPWKGQALGFVSLTVPVLLYFSLCESSRWQATLGKRALGLRVVDGAQGRPSRVQALARAALKFLPWELGHVVPHQLVARGDAAGDWVWIVAGVSLSLSLVYLVAIFVGRGRTPYDWLSRTSLSRG